MVKINKKRKILFFVLMLLMTSVFIGEKSHVKAHENEDIKVMITESLSVDKKQATIDINVVNLKTNVVIEGIQLPDKNTVEASHVSYDAKMNDVYNFIIHYKIITDTPESQLNMDIKGNQADDILLSQEKSKEEIVEKQDTSSENNSASLDEKQKVIDTKEIIEYKHYEASYKISSIEDNANIQNSPTADISTKAYTDENLFEIDANGIITGFLGMKSWIGDPDVNSKSNGDVIIPPIIKGVSVTGIGDGAFNGDMYWYTEFFIFDSLTLPATIKSIGNQAFYNVRILGDADFVIPDNVETLGVESFRSLSCKNIVLPENKKLSALPNSLFSGMVLDGGQGTLKIPEGITTIIANGGANLMCEGAQIKRLELPSTLSYIPPHTFKRGGFKEADFSKLVNLVGIGDYAFSENQIVGELDLSISPNLTGIGKGSFEGNKFKKVSFPASIISIGAWAFSNNVIQDVVFPLEELKGKPLALGYRCFGNSNKLFYLNFPGININVNGSGSELEWIYDPSAGGTVPVAVTGNLLGDNNVSGVAYINIGGKNVVPIETLFPGINKARFNINTLRTLEYFNKNLKIDLNDPSEVKKYMPIYDQTKGHLILPDDSVLNSVINVDGTLKKVKDIYGMVYEYIVASDSLNPDGSFVYSDNGSFITLNQFDEGITVTFDFNRGITPPEIMVAGAFKDRPIIQPMNPTRVGYVFEGWYTDPTGGTKWDFVNNTSSSDMTLYAHWALKKEVVTFDGNGGMFGNDKTFTLDVSNSTIIGSGNVNNPTHPDNFKFSGWNTGKDGKGKSWDLDTDTVSGPLTLYALWQWDETIQDPLMLVTIPKAVSLKEDQFDTNYASATDEIKVVSGTSFDQWLPEKNIEVYSDTSVKLTNPTTNDFYDVFILNDAGNKHSNKMLPLIVLNAHNLNGYNKTSHFTLKTSLSGNTKQAENYTGTMIFDIKVK